MTLASLRSSLAAWSTEVWQAELLGSFFQAAVLLVAGLVLARLARLAIMRTFSKTLSRQQLMLLRRAVSYTVLGLFAVSALRELGFDFGVLLGAAGIVTLAVGFASQTSVSNLISGLFVVLERAVEVGDVITVDGTTGEVLSVDLLSTKLRTFDNLFVRIPNETMVKTKITNLNRFPLRRVDFQLGVAYKEELGKVINVLKDAASKNKLCLDEPEPMFIAQGFGDSSVDYQFSVWGKTENYLTLRNSMQGDIKAALDAAGIEIPFPHRSLYMGSASEPFPVRVVTEALATEADTQSEEQRWPA